MMILNYLEKTYILNALLYRRIKLESQQNTPFNLETINKLIDRFEKEINNQVKDMVNSLTSKEREQNK